MIAAWSLAAKDFRLEARGRDLLTATLLVALLVVTVGLLAFHDLEAREAVAAGVLWTGITFGASVGLARSFTSERDRGTLDTLLLLPVQRSAIYFGKLLANSAVVLLVEAIAIPAYAALAQGSVPFARPLLAPILVLGTLGVAGSATILAAIASATRLREAMLPVLLFPVLAPILVAGVHATAETLAGARFEDVRGELALLLGYDIALLAASALLFETAVEG